MNVYFDNAATTKIHPKVLEKMIKFLNDDFGNPSSIHSFGRKVKVEIENAREIIANLINADPSEIYFTSGGTEANNMAIKGIAETYFNESGKKTIISSKVEHHSVIDSMEYLEKKGFNYIKLNPQNDTTVEIEKLKYLVDKEANLISMMHTNNETGSVNNIPEIRNIIGDKEVFIHSDCVQAFGKTIIDVQKLKVDALSASAHKINGPKGVGFVYIKNQTPMSSLLHGGPQERNRRGGTENVSGIMGLAEAAKIAYENLEDTTNHVRNLRNRFISGMQNITNGFEVNEAETNSPYVLSLTLKKEYFNLDPETLFMNLDLNGIAASNGAACSSGTLKPSHVILDSGKDPKDAGGTIRFSFSYYNTNEEVDYVLEIMNKICNKFKL